MRRWRKNRWFKRVVTAAGLWALTVGFALFTGHDAHPIALAAGTLAALGIGWLCLDLFPEGATGEWTLYWAPAPDRSFDPRFSRLSQQLDEDLNREAAATLLHASLTSVAKGILFDKYEVDSGRDPDAARQILGPQAWSYLEHPPGPGNVVFTPQLFATLDTLESL